MPITIDYTNMLAGPHLGDGAGIAESDWRGAAEAFARARAGVERRRAAGELGFIDLAQADAPGVAEVKRFADTAGQAFSDVVVLGIGGSALGTIALRSALRSTVWNALSDEQREFFPRLHVLENVDPVTVAGLLDRIDLGRALFLVISKSGATAETMAQYLIVRDRLQRSLGDNFRGHLLFITDPAKGVLRPIAAGEGIGALAIPPNVGGRFSVLSPVGLLPAALVGVDVDALLAGAREMAARCAGDRLEENPAAVFAVLQWLADTRLGRRNHVLMPYSDPLRELSAWFVQLWAESLGKHDASGRGVGPTPIAALGATDQHSQVQLFMEGTPDKTLTFVAVGETPVDVTIPTGIHAEVPDLAYLGGHTLFELLNAERRATAAALARRGRLNMTIAIDRVDAHHVGGLIMLLEYATVIAGELYGINPLDQPGVELGKKYTYALMGRADAEDARREWDALPKAEETRVV